MGKCGLESQLCLDCPGGPGVVPTSLASPRPGPARPPACCLQDAPLVLLGPHTAPPSLLLCGVVSRHTAPRPLRSHRGLGNGQNPPAPRGPPAELPARRSQRAGVLGKASQFPLSSCPSRWPGQGGITEAGSSRTSASQLTPPAPRPPPPPAWPQSGAEAPGEAGSGLEVRSAPAKGTFCSESWTGCCGCGSGREGEQTALRPEPELSPSLLELSVRAMEWPGDASQDAQVWQLFPKWQAGHSKLQSRQRVKGSSESAQVQAPDLRGVRRGEEGLRFSSPDQALWAVRPAPAPGLDLLLGERGPRFSPQ